MNDRDRPRLNLSERDLALAVQDNLFDLFRALARLPGSELEELEGYSRHHAFPSNPMFKGVWATRLDPESVDDAIKVTLAWYRRRDAPFVFWWAGPGTEPASLGARLESHAFRPFDVEAPGQVADLDGLDWDASTRVPDAFRVERVADDESLQAFGSTFVQAFAIPDWAGRAWVDATRTLGIGATPWDLYVGWLGDTPVATNLLFCGGGVAGVFGIGTVAAARGQGIGAAITLAGLADARDQGYRYGVLFATELGAPVYRRIGFRDTDVTISRWLWIREG